MSTPQATQSIDLRLRQLELAINSAPDPAQRAELLAERCELFLAKGDLNSAQAAIDAQLAAVSDPQARTTICMKQAGIELALGNWKQAADRYDAALKEVPANLTEVRRQILMAKANNLASHDIALVSADLDKLDAEAPDDGWPQSIDIRIAGLLAAGQAKEAQEWMNDHLNPKFATHPAAYQLRGEIALKLGNTVEVQQQCAQALEIAHDPTDGRAWGAAMMCAFGLQRWDKAVSIFEQFSEASPEKIDATTRVLAAIAYARINKYEKALELTDKDEEVAPQFRSIRDMARAEAQLRAGNYEAVLKTISSEALERVKSSPELLVPFQLTRIQALNQVKKFHEAQTVATSVLKSTPDESRGLSGLVPFLKVAVLVQRSLSFFSLENYDQAQQDIDNAISGFEKVRSTDAVQLLSKGPDFDSFESSLWYAKGAVLESENRADETLAAYTRSYTLEVSGSKAAIARGYSLIAVGRFTDAIVTFDVALSRADSVDGKATALAGKGKALLGLHRLEAAITALEAALDARLTEPRNESSDRERDAVIHEDLGIAYYSLERNKAALSAFELAWHLTPEEKRDKRKANLARGICAAQLKLERPAEALKRLDELAPDLQADPKLLFNRALALDRTGKRREAMKVLVRAKHAGLSEAHDALDCLDRPTGLNRWTRNWFGVQVSWLRWALGLILIVIALLGLVALLYQGGRGRIEWYWLLTPSLAALILFALPSLQAISVGGVKLEAEPIAATGRNASTPQTFEIPTFATPLPPK